MSDYRHLELEDDEYNEADHWGEDPIFSSIEEINTQIEEMKNFMSESKKRTEIQGTIIQEMRRRLSEAELVAEQQQKTIHDLSEQLVTVRTMAATSESVIRVSHVRVTHVRVSHNGLDYIRVSRSHDRDIHGGGSIVCV